MKYAYYGAEHNDIHTSSPDYPGVNTPQQLYSALTKVWCVETCTPNLQSRWSKDNMTDGQCSITALLVQEMFGGEVYGIRLLGGAVHCYNEVNGHIIDLTSEQFGDKAKSLQYNKNPLLERDQQLADEVKRLRYELLRAKLKALLTGDQ